jgi:hypothetical protein
VAHQKCLVQPAYRVCFHCTCIYAPQDMVGMVCTNCKEAGHHDYPIDCEVCMDTFDGPIPYIIDTPEDFDPNI